MDKYKHIITNSDIIAALNVDYKNKLEKPSEIDRELRQNYTRLISYVFANNVYLTQAGSDNEGYKSKQYNKEATNPYEAFYNQLDTDFKVEMWKHAQAIQAVYEIENGTIHLVLPEHSTLEDIKARNHMAICREAFDILMNVLKVIKRTESGI